MVSITVDDNIVLRTYTPDDAGELFSVINSNRAHLHPWLPWVDKTTKQEHSLQFIEQSLHELNMQQSLVLGIFYYNRIIGGIGMHDWHQPTKRAQAGYWISKDYEGRGIMTRCMTYFTGYLFDRIGLNKVELQFVPANKRSAKMAERLGFKIEGVIRQSTLRNGMPEDLVVAGLLKSERKN